MKQRLLAMLAAIALAPAAALACIDVVPQGPPPTLADHVAGAEVIVVARVIAVREAGEYSNRDVRAPRLAIDVVVKRSLKGELREHGVIYLGMDSCSASQPQVGRTYLLATFTNRQHAKDMLSANHELTILFPTSEQIARIASLIPPPSRTKARQ